MIDLGKIAVDRGNDGDIVFQQEIHECPVYGTAEENITIYGKLKQKPGIVPENFGRRGDIENLVTGLCQPVVHLVENDLADLCNPSGPDAADYTKVAHCFFLFTDKRAAGRNHFQQTAVNQQFERLADRDMMRPQLFGQSVNARQFIAERAIADHSFQLFTQLVTFDLGHVFPPFDCNYTNRYIAVSRGEKKKSGFFIFLSCQLIYKELRNVVRNFWGLNFQQDSKIINFSASNLPADFPAGWCRGKRVFSDV